MKLIDILVEELPKRCGWPEGADYCIQHAHDLGFRWVIFNKGIVNSTSADAEGKWEMDWKFSHKHDFCADELASDHTTAIITRDQYEAALDAKNEGWINWGGGKHPPVSTKTVVDVKFKDGQVQSGYPAGEYSWEHAWQSSNIIAYRLHQPQEAEQEEADDESDLNECIGQGAAPVWNGEGLPPVGMEVEYKFVKANYRTYFSRGKVLAYGMHNVFMEHGASKNEFIQPLDKMEFRPIRSEADRKREEAVKTIMLTGWCQDAAEEIYDLVAAGKVPGMKLED